MPQLRQLLERAAVESDDFMHRPVHLPSDGTDPSDDTHYDEDDIHVVADPGVEPDAVTVDALARLQLAARRHGCRVRLCSTSKALRELVSFMGLTDVLPER